MVKQVVVIPLDVEMSRGKLAAQTAHASVGAALLAADGFEKEFNDWLGSGMTKIVLQVATTEQLKELIKVVKATTRLPFYAVRDAGKTELPPGTITALAIGPSYAEEIDAITGSLLTLKDKTDGKTD